jgi:hypothetical protein
MARIRIDDINTTVSDSFSDTYSFLQEISTDELELTYGGLFLTALGIALGAAAFGYTVGADHRTRYGSW